ncbi:MAG: LptF/LptG family permease [Planctomycetota bacterium]|jgi:lipopolysaccharide export LptBFGC system permease protein LptF
MLWTLQWYVFRELGKSFLLTAIGLTAILGMGGGVLNIIELQQVTAGQLLRIMSLVLPVAATLALPVAALFSAAVTYGRFSADNEFVACRASGINIQWLFAPTVSISLVSAALTFVSINYVIPDGVRNLEQFIRADLSRIVLQQLQAPGRLPLGEDRFRIYAEDPRVVESGDLPRDSQEIYLSKAAFVEMDRDNWRRYGTAKSVRVRFAGLDTEPTVRAELYGVAAFDRASPGWLEGDQAIESLRVPRKFPLKVKWLNLGELFHYRHRPEKLPEVQDALEQLRALLAREYFFRSLHDDFASPDASGQPDCELTFADDKSRIDLQAEALVPDLHDYKPTFETVSVVETVGQQVRRATADGGTIDIDGRGEVYLKLVSGVRVSEGNDGTRTIERPSYTVGPVAIPAEIRTKAASISDSELLGPAASLGSGRDFTRKRGDTIAERDEFQRKILAVIHSRLAFCVSTIVLVVLGAALGIVFRGAHVLTAFGISFVPSLFVIVAIIMGRQLAQNEGTALLGVCMIWAGILLVGGVDVWTLTRVLKR